MEHNLSRNKAAYSGEQKDLTKNASAQRKLNRARVLGIMIYPYVTGMRVLRCFFGDDSA